MKESPVKRVIFFFWRSVTVIKEAFSHLSSQNKIAMRPGGVSLARVWRVFL